MQVPFRRLFLLLVGAAGLSGACSAEVTRIACVGDSNTFGATLPDREHASYPAQLQDILGGGYEVKNFGVNGRTMLSKGDFPWSKDPAAPQVAEYRPDIVVLSLGGNDSKPHNWEHGSEFGADTRALVEKLKATPGHPRVIVCSPAPAFKGPKGEDVFGIRDEVIVKELIPALIPAAKASGAEFVDMHQELLLYGAGKVKSWMADGIHPNAFGTEAMAKRLAEQIRVKADLTYDVAARLKTAGVEAKESEFLGYRKFDFALTNMPKVPCIVVAPHTPVEGHPWIWRARFFGHEPALDSALLDRGYHLAYCDIVELLGNDEACQRWDKFYALSQTLGFAPKMILEGMSRGGFTIFNWGKKNPEKVAAIYGDNPACVIQDWPGGGELHDLALKLYGLSGNPPPDFPGSPVNGLEPLAKAGVPLFFVIGADDDIVKHAENADVITERYRKMGGGVQRWVKPGMGHHPHGLSPVFPLLRGLLKATGRDVAVSTNPVASVEFRAGGQWQGRTWLQEAAHVKAALAAAKDPQLVLLGDSISQGWTGSENRIATEGGPRLFDRSYAKYRAVNGGISGNRTEHVLAMLEGGLLDEVKPKLIVLMIGVNNLVAGDQTGTETALGAEAIVNDLRKRQPQASVLVLGGFPAMEPGSIPRVSLDGYHEQLVSWVAAKQDSRVRYLDPQPAFLNPDGSLNGGVGADKIHLTPAGYDAWAALIEKLVNDVLVP